jgi:beta-N-acetylhexosaminidase
MMPFRSIVRGVARVCFPCLGLVLLLAADTRFTAAQTDVIALAESLPTRRRVGQLFVVPFDGAFDSGDPDSERLRAWIVEDGIGGVILSPQRGNFVNDSEAPAAVAALAERLQQQAGAAEPALPLWVTMDAVSEQRPGPVLWSGLAPRASAMAIGATWQPEHARTVGKIIGREMSRAGVNLLLGPSLDVQAVPRPGSSGDLGSRSFGGDPAWVARMGRAWIDGVHDGSVGRLAVAPGSFPGVGSADRSQAKELPLVDAEPEALAGLELVPFSAVADRTGIDRGAGVADALQTAHARYRGLQRQPDRPLSLDAGGLTALLAPGTTLGDWRASGGVLVSGGLGQTSVRTYVDPELREFNVRRVVREALLAGNDLLLLSGFASAEEVTEAIDWLARAYEEDETIRAAVDRSLRRVLTLKRGVFTQLSAEQAIASLSEMEGPAGVVAEEAAPDADALLAVARDALTLLAPASPQSTLASPQRGERILFVVDAREIEECPTCEAYRLLDPNRFVETTLRIYGPEGSGNARVADAADVGAITFRELRAWLGASGRLTEEDNPGLVPAPPAAEVARIEELLQSADWLVFAQRDVRPSDAPGSDALELYLREAPAEGAAQHRVAFAFDAPYSLDTTEIAKLSAYYALYAPTAPFVDTAVRALFADETPTGASPVSVPGVGYDLASRLAPALDQTVSLELVGRDPVRPVARGSEIVVRTSPILDANGHEVPDDTSVSFRGYDRVEDVFLRDSLGETIDGRAQVTVGVDRELEITARLENGLVSEPLLVRIEERAEAPAENGLAGLGERLLIPQAPVDWTVLLLSLTMVLLAGLFVFGADLQAVRSPSRLLRLFLLCVAWGMAGYLLVVAGGLRLDALPGGTRVWPAGWRLAYQAPAVSFLFALLPVLPALLRSLLGAAQRG